MLPDDIQYAPALEFVLQDEVAGLESFHRFFTGDQVSVDIRLFYGHLPSARESMIYSTIHTQPSKHNRRLTPYIILAREHWTSRQWVTCLQEYFT